MDWSSSKGPSWDWPEEESFLLNNNNDGSDVDLKLGSVIASSQTQLGGSSSAASNLPSKRARAVANSSTQAAASQCLVDGCTSDLSNCRDYHRRHKVCEVHSKTPEVTIQGRKQRFCQQCSRFHSPEEFDEGKRSCRKRLDGHNRRRRKPQPEAHLQQGTYLPNFPGAGMLSFSNPPRYTHTMTTSLVTLNSSWSGSTIKHEDPYNTQQQKQLNLVDKQIPFTDYSSSYREAKQLTLMHGGHQTNQRHHHAATPQSSEHKVFYDGLTQAPESDCALSLLSRPQLLPMHMQHNAPTEINFRSAVPMRPHTLSADSSSSLHPTAVSGSDVNFQHMYQSGTEVANDTQTLPFYWE